MPAMNYETLIRRVYKVGRYGKPGADADIWRSLERSVGHLKSEIALKEQGLPKQWNRSIPDLEDEVHTQLYKVSGFISEALTDSLKKFSDVFSKDEKEVIQESIANLEDADFEKVSLIVRETTDLFVSKNIFPG